MRLIPFIFVLLLLQAPPAVSAQEVDACAAFEARSAEVVGLRDRDAAEGLRLGQELLAEWRATGQECASGEALMLAAIGANLHILGRIDESVHVYREAQELLPADADPRHFATVHRGAGVALVEAEDFEAALESYLAALRASRDAGDRLEAGKTAGNIGNLYNTLADYPQSRRFHQEALEDFEAAGFEPGVAGTLVNLGALAAKLASDAALGGDPDGERREAALQQRYNEEALAIFTRLGNERGIAYATANIGMALERLGETERALEYHLRAQALRRQVGDAFGAIHSGVAIASALTTLGRYDEAQQRLDAAQAALPEGNIGLALDVARQQAELHEARGDLAAALRSQREQYRLRSALSAELHDAQLEKLHSRFRFDQQAREIELLRSDAEINALQLDRQRMMFRVGVVVAVLLGLVALLLWSRLRVGRIAARKLERVARTDPLTGLPNRRAMAERIQQEIVRGKRSGKPFSLLMIDVDGFKAINDRHGHDRGDQVLIEVAERLRTNLRGQDLLARWGGEEFLALLPETGVDGAAAVAEKLRAGVAERTVAAGDVPQAVTVTLGAAAWQQGMDADSVVKGADAAMYAGKREGGNRASRV